MKTWEHETIRDAANGAIAGQLCDWPEVAEALMANGIPLHPVVRMKAVKEICRLILSERKTTDKWCETVEAHGLQSQLLERGVYVSRQDVAECYRNYCEDFACGGWLELSYWDGDDHIGPVDYIAARVSK